MSGIIKESLDIFGIGGGGKKKKSKPSEVPTIDQARASQIESDRIRRRRGNLSNIYAGPMAASPAVAGARLLGG